MASVTRQACYGMYSTVLPTEAAVLREFDLQDGVLQAHAQPDRCQQTLSRLSFAFLNGWVGWFVS
jgi:hypothetical protein